MGCSDAYGCRGETPWPSTEELRCNWEDEGELETKNIGFLGASFWRLRIIRFHSVPPSLIKRSTRMGDEVAGCLSSRRADSGAAIVACK